jgi:hypothetical protein
MLVAVHAYQLFPGAALVSKKASPMLHVAGNAAPDLKGLVAAARLKSTFFTCDRRSSSVCAFVTPTTDAIARYTFTLFIFYTPPLPNR